MSGCNNAQQFVFLRGTRVAFPRHNRPLNRYLREVVKRKAGVGRFLVADILGFTPGCNSLPDAIVGLGFPPKNLHLTKIYYNLIII